MAEGIDMTLVDNIKQARGFPTHRAMIAEITRLKDAGEIDGYSIHMQPQGVVAGVRIGERWQWLA